MKKLLNTAILFFACATLIGVHCFGQVSFEDMANPPKTGAEAMKYLDKYLKPKINDTLIAQLFEEADVVFEGELTSTVKTGHLQERIYHIEPYKIFKGVLQKDSVVKILANGRPQNATYDLGEWSHGRGIALFFVKKDPQNENIYRFVNPKNAWVGYAGRFISPITFEKQYKIALYDKMLGQKGAKYEKTPFFYKKKERLNVGNAAMRGGNDTITGFSRDTVPAGIRATNASHVTIYGNGFGTVKGNRLVTAL